MATDASVPNNFVAGTPSVADDVDANFAAVVNWINANAVHLDASKAFTAVPSGPASDPTSANQLTRKAYVDTLVPRGGKVRATYSPTMKAGGNPISLGNGTLTAYRTVSGCYCDVEIFHQLGSTTSYGLGGTLTFTLPADAPAETAFRGFSGGTGVIQRGATPYLVQVSMSASDEITMTVISTATVVTHTNPIAFGAADFMRIAFRYPTTA
jgi:hypothetical protein